MKIFEKEELKKLWPFYLDSIISPMLFFAPAFFVIYFLNLNLSFLQIGILMAMPPLLSLLFEIPTGAIADLYGRKFSVLLGYFLEGIAIFLMFFAKSYSSILILFAFWGFASTFSSGSKEAWVIDSIDRKSKKLVANFFNKTQIFDSFALIVSGIIGAFLVVVYGLSVIWVVGAISFLISFIVLLLFAPEIYETKKVKVGKAFRDLWKQSKETIDYGYKHHVLYYYLLATFLLMLASAFTFSLTWTAFLKELNFPDYAFGYLWSLMAAMTMIAPMISSKLLKHGKEKKFMVVCLILSAIVILFVLLPKTWFFALVVMLMFELFIEMRSPASRIYFHRFIPTEIRATMGSVKQMIMSFAAVIGPPIVGYIMDKIGPRYSIVLYSPLIIPVLWAYWKIKKENIGGGKGHKK